MSDAPAPAAPADAPAPAADPNAAAPAAPADVRPDVPVENQVGEWKRKAEKAEKEAADLRKWREEQEQAKLSETEKATKAREAAEARATAAEEKATKLERNGWISEAARAAGFNVPTDAVVHLRDKLGDIEDEAAAQKAVKAFADQRPDLLATSGKPSGFGSIGGAPKKEDVPLDENGKPDVKLGLGRELMQGLLGGGKS